MTDMSNSSRGPAQLSIAPEMPRGEVVGRYRTYAQAQEAVDHMADENFPVAMVSIIGSDLKSVEQVTGRLSYPRVALQGALNGIVFGAFFGLLMSLLGGADIGVSLGLTMVLGGAFWMLMATITYAFSRGKRDFTSTSRIVAGSYEVLAAPEVAGQARQVLGAMQRGQGSGPGGPGQPSGGYRDPVGPSQGGWNGGQNGGHPGEQGRGQQPPYGGQGMPPQQYRPQQQDPRAQAPAQGGSGQPQGSSPAGAEQRPAQDSANRSAKFPDLPDGRPQYGIRLEPEAPAAPQQGQGAPWNRPADDAAAPGRATDGPVADSTSARDQETARLPEDRRDS